MLVCVSGYVLSVNMNVIIKLSSLLFGTSMVQVEQPEGIPGNRGKMLVSFFDLSSSF